MYECLWQPCANLDGATIVPMTLHVVLDARVWLGRSWGTIYHRVAVHDEVLEVRAVQGGPFFEWCRGAFERLRGKTRRHPSMKLLPPLP